MIPFSVKPQREVLSYWFAHAENFNTSSKEFYALIRAELEARKIPGLNLSTADFAEGGALSAKREYLRLTRERLAFDICAAPFGTGYFFSCRFGEAPIRVNPIALLILVFTVLFLFGKLIQFLGFIWGTIVFGGGIGLGIWFLRNAVLLGLYDLDHTLLHTPGLGPIYERYFRKETYYRHDTRLMYMQTVPQVVKDLVNKITAAEGVKLLREVEQKPFLGNLYTEVTHTPKLHEASKP